MFLVMENEELKTRILEKIKELFPSIAELDEILKNEFKEENVDVIDSIPGDIITNYDTDKLLENEALLRNAIVNCFRHYALVRFPEVDVTNENNEKIRIYDLFVEIPVSIDGIMTDSNFSMLRSTYTKQQYASRYCHSHIPQIRCFSDAMEFKRPCLGNGPIRLTMQTLNEGFNPDIWGLFAYELKLYVQTESLKGGPYIRMSSVAGREPYVSAPYYKLGVVVANTVDKFIRWMYNNNLCKMKFGFSKGSFKIGLPKSEALLTLSGLFGKWHVEEMISDEHNVMSLNTYMTQCVINDDEVYRYSQLNTNRGIDFIQDHYMFMFREEPVTSKLIEDTIQPDVLVLLRPEIYNYIVNNLIIILNTYGEREKHSEEGDNGKSVKVVL